MPVYRIPDRARADARERVDLCQQYRPIGISAVAAALSATKFAGRRAAEDTERPAETIENRYADPLAA